ncbi:hypothetical protein [Stenotrophomonas sp.]|uniref:hypothetical protein n=1 Tax=Stenotrophomonas sp. TaxID=69392 RepID=UPI0028AF709A|nr:hypothetical protein [Stenotrophomonas sp.]
MTYDSSGFTGLINSTKRIEALVSRLNNAFPEVGSILSWHDAIFSAQEHYSDLVPKHEDIKIFIATRWLELAEKGLLKVEMSQVEGLIVCERQDAAPTNDSDPDPIIRRQIEKTLFRELQRLPNDRNLLYSNLMVSFQNATGNSLREYAQDLVGIVNELEGKHYLRCVSNHNRPPHFCRGVDFDEWEIQMTGTQPQTSNTFTIHGSVGAIQTGAHSTANVKQSIDSTQMTELKDLLQRALIEIKNSQLSADARSNAEELIENAIAEVEKPAPSKISIQSLLSGLATVVQTLGSSSDAYSALSSGFEALKGAINFFGASIR